MIATLSRNGLSPIEAAIVGSAVAMIVESRFCMNIAQATISITTSCRWPVVSGVCITSPWRRRLNRTVSVWPARRHAVKRGAERRRDRDTVRPAIERAGVAVLAGQPDAIEARKQRRAVQLADDRVDLALELAGSAKALMSTTQIACPVLVGVVSSLLKSTTSSPLAAPVQRPASSPNISANAAPL